MFFQQSPINLRFSLPLCDSLLLRFFESLQVNSSELRRHMEVLPCGGHRASFHQFLFLPNRKDASQVSGCLEFLLEPGQRANVAISELFPLRLKTCVNFQKRTAKGGATVHQFCGLVAESRKANCKSQDCK